MPAIPIQTAGAETADVVSLALPINASSESGFAKHGRVRFCLLYGSPFAFV
jgi:hypothetical protein